MCCFKSNSASLPTRLCCMMFACFKLIWFVCVTGTGVRAHELVLFYLRLLYPAVIFIILNYLTSFNLWDTRQTSPEGDGEHSEWMSAMQPKRCFKWVFELRIIAQFNFFFCFGKARFLIILSSNIISFPPTWAATPFQICPHERNSHRTRGARLTSEQLK